MKDLEEQRIFFQNVWFSEGFYEYLFLLVDIFKFVNISIRIVSVILSGLFLTGNASNVILEN